MSRPPLKRLALLCSCLLVALFASGAQAALIETGDLVLRADGGFEPRMLPRRGFAPISFSGRVDFGSRSGGRPAALTQVVLDFDRDGRIDTRGLPTCAPETIADASVAEARSLCAGAIVGTGKLEALIEYGGSRFPASSPLTLFNGPPAEGHPTAVLHAQTTSPATQTFAIVVPIERRHGAYSYRATVDVPPILGGNGSLTHVDLKIGRRFRSGGRQRSYVSARCSDSILETRGRFTFADGLIIDGGVEKFCRAK